jgi:hypothetical protein
LDSTRRLALVLAFAFVLAVAPPEPASAAPVPLTVDDTAGGCASQLPMSDDSGTIAAWQSDCDLTGGNADGSVEIFRKVGAAAAVQVTSGTGCTSDRPSISADGTRIAFRSTCNLLGGNNDGNSEIFVWKAGTLAQLTTSSGCDNLAPSISRNGNFVAFDSTCNVSGTNNDGRGSEIYRVAVNTGVLKQLTVDAVGDCDSTSPSINSNGSLVAFDSDCDLTGENDANAIAIFTVTSGGDVAQKTFAPDDSCSSLRPVIDAAGSILAFHSDCDFTGGNAENHVEIFTVDASGVRQVTTAPSGATCESGELRMASSGAAVAFTSWCRLNNQNADGNLEVFHSGIGKFQGGILALTNTTGCTSFAGGLGASGTRVTFDTDCDLDGSNPDRSVEVFRDGACVCGAPATRRKPLSSDALFVLRAAVGSAACNVCECDTNNDGFVTATDSLRDLRVAVGQAGVVLTCPAP